MGLFLKKYQKKHLCHRGRNYCYFCKTNNPVTNLILGSRNMIKLSKKRRGKLSGFFLICPRNTTVRDVHRKLMGI